MSSNLPPQPLRKFLRGSAAGAVLAAIALSALALFASPFGNDHAAILSGAIPLNQVQRLEYQRYLAWNFSIDNFYLSGDVLTWTGLASLMWLGCPLPARLVLGVGVGGALLDFLENAMRWSLAGEFVHGRVVDVVTMRVWSVTWSLSYTAVFVAAPIAALGLLGRQRDGRMLLGCALLGMMLLPGTYFDGYDFTYTWLVCWHLAAAVVLWRAAEKVSPGTNLNFLRNP